MTKDSAADRVAWWLGQVEGLRHELAALPGVREVLDDDWFDRLKRQILERSSSQKLPDGPFQLLRILKDALGEGPGVLARLESSLGVLMPLARRQARTRQLRETLYKVRGPQVNQIRAALFELFVVALFSRSASNDNHAVELFPFVGTGGSTLEVRVMVSGRWLNIEVQALGYTKHDYLAGEPGVFYHSDATQQRQLSDALKAKVGRGAQLALAPDDEPTLLCLALGFNAMPSDAPEHLLECYAHARGQRPSAVLLWNSATFPGTPRLVENPWAGCPLSQGERSFLGA